MANKDMAAPTDEKGAERLLEIVNYLGEFSPNLPTVTQPIRTLLRNDTDFQGSSEQDNAFEEIKNL